MAEMRVERSPKSNAKGPTGMAASGSSAVLELDLWSYLIGDGVGIGLKQQIPEVFFRSTSCDGVL